MISISGSAKPDWKTGDPGLLDHGTGSRTRCENRELAASMRASGLFEDTGARIATGRVQAAVWRIKDPAHVPPLERTQERERI